MSGKTEQRLAALGIVLPAAPAPVGSYVAHARAGNLLFISGQLSRGGDGRLVTGVLGGGLGVAAGQAAARLCALNILAQAKAALGDLDRIVQVVRLTGFVASAPGFTEQPQVVNGASDLLAEVLGERGMHTRAAVGVVSLPAGCAVEIDAIIAVVG